MTRLFHSLQDEDDEEEEDDEYALHQFNTWSPEPVNVDICSPAKARRMHDIISMLVHIYGSKDLFINEYRCLLPSYCSSPHPTLAGQV